jgi:membrane-associated phospholipid phosphatase
MNEFRDWLFGLDMTPWFYLHVRWRSEALDALMPYMRNQFFWAPWYLFLLIFMPANFGKRGWIWLAGFLLCFALGDISSGHFLKHWIERVRPCNDPRLAQYVHLIVPRSSGWSFPSSHAANHFALGTFCAVTFHHRLKWFWPVPVFWALIVGYAQVYVGVHYPMDVLGGALLGGLIGIVVAWVFHQRWTLRD